MQLISIQVSTFPGLLQRLCGGGCGGYVVVVAETMWWLEEFELGLGFCLGLGKITKIVAYLSYSAGSI